MGAKGWPAGKPSAYARSSAYWSRKSSAVSASRLRRRARAVRWSVPGARPMPRSMRSGYSAAEDAERFGDLERRVVRQHDAAGADANRRGGRRDGRDHHLRAGADHARDVVVLSQPVPVVAGGLGTARQLERLVERLGRTSPRSAPAKDQARTEASAQQSRTTATAGRCRLFQALRNQNGYGVVVRASRRGWDHQANWVRRVVAARGVVGSVGVPSGVKGLVGWWKLRVSRMVTAWSSPKT